MLDRLPPDVCYDEQPERPEPWWSNLDGYGMDREQRILAVDDARIELEETRHGVNVFVVEKGEACRICDQFMRVTRVMRGLRIIEKNYHMPHNREFLPIQQRDPERFFVMTLSPGDYYVHRVGGECILVWRDNVGTKQVSEPRHEPVVWERLKVAYAPPPAPRRKAPPKPAKLIRRAAPPEQQVTAGGYLERRPLKLARRPCPS